MALIDRYLNGEREKVWDELIDLGPRVRNAEFLVDAQAVVDETMFRARRNIELLAQLLPTMGWEFQHPLQGRADFAVWAPPSAETSSETARLEAELGGPVALSIASFWRIVGAVDLTRRPGSGPTVEYPDPLVVLSPAAVLEELAEWTDDETFRQMQPGFVAPLAPDSFHKEDVSGGPAYGMELPEASVDGTVLNLEPPMKFVAYLRRSFRWAGLPGYSQTYSEPPTEISTIADQLEAL